MQQVNKDERACSQSRVRSQSQLRTRFNDGCTKPNLSYAGAAKRGPLPNDNSLDASIHNPARAQDSDLISQPIRATPYNRFDDEDATNILRSFRDVQNQLQTLTSAVSDLCAKVERIDNRTQALDLKVSMVEQRTQRPFSRNPNWEDEENFEEARDWNFHNAPEYPNVPMDDTQQGQSKTVYDFPVEREALQSKSKDEVIDAYCSTREELEEVRYQLDTSTTEQQQLRIELENTNKEVNQLQQTVADLIAKITPNVSQ